MRVVRIHVSLVISVCVIFIFSQVNGNLVNGMFELKSLRTSQANWAVVFLFSEVETQDVERVLSRPSWLAQDFHILISRALLLSLLLLVNWKDSWRAAAHFVNLPRSFSRIFWFYLHSRFYDSLDGIDSHPFIYSIRVRVLSGSFAVELSRHSIGGLTSIDNIFCTGVF